MTWIYLENLTDSTCSQESVEIPLHSETTSKQLPIVKTINTLSLSYYHECTQEILSKRQFGTTSIFLPKNNSMSKSTSSWAGSLVLIFPWRVNKQESHQTQDQDYSSKLSGSQKNLNHNIYSLKMLPPYEGTAWTLCVENLPKSGMICDGLLYLLEKSAQNIKEIDGLCSPTGEIRTVPTPNTLDGNPPRTIEGIQHQFAHARKGRTAPANLREWIHPQMWPTPCSRDYKGGNDPVIVIAKGRNPETNNLADAIRAFPTPTKEDYRRRGPNSKQQGLPEFVHEENKGQLNPDWTEWLMGFPVGWTIVNEDILKQIYQGNKKRITPSPVAAQLEFKLSSDYWNEEPYIPRITLEKSQRAERIKRLGNAVVPLQAKIAFEMLFSEIGK